MKNDPATQVFEISPNEYATADGRVIKREAEGLTPNGNPVANRWVLRSSEGAFLDIHQYRNDIFEHKHMRLVLNDERKLRLGPQ